MDFLNKQFLEHCCAHAGRSFVGRSIRLLMEGNGSSFKTRKNERTEKVTSVHNLVRLPNRNEFLDTPCPVRFSYSNDIHMKRYVRVLISVKIRVAQS